MDVFWTLIAAFGGGLIGSVISAVVSWNVRRADRRDRAAEMLWAYAHALRAFESKKTSWIVDGRASLLHGDFAQVREALRAAYPYARYLSQSAQKTFFREAAIDVPEESDGFGDELIAGASAGQLATKLERVLIAAFQQRSRNSREDLHE
jgi:hypothetical protein